MSREQALVWADAQLQVMRHHRKEPLNWRRVMLMVAIIVALGLAFLTPRFARQVSAPAELPAPSSAP